MNKFKKKGQSAIELIMLISLVLFIFLSLLLVIQKNLSQKYTEERNAEIKRVAYQIQEEINLAHSSSEGYRREFRIPLDIRGIEYHAQIVDGMIFLNTSDEKSAIALPIKNTTGYINISLNTIRKINSGVYLNV